MKSSSFLGIILNFCLGSQPSGIPLVLHGLPFGFQSIEAPYIAFHYYFHFFFSLMLSLPFFFLFFFPDIYIYIYIPRYGYKRGFGCFNLLLYPLTRTSLRILGTTSFIKMTWALRRTWNLWVTSRRSTFNGSWSGGTSQEWFTVAARTIVYL